MPCTFNFDGFIETDMPRAYTQTQAPLGIVGFSLGAAITLNYAIRQAPLPDLQGRYEWLWGLALSAALPASLTASTLLR